MPKVKTKSLHSKKSEKFETIDTDELEEVLNKLVNFNKEIRKIKATPASLKTKIMEEIKELKSKIKKIQLDNKKVLLEIKKSIEFHNKKDEEGSNSDSGSSGSCSTSDSSDSECEHEVLHSITEDHEKVLANSFQPKKGQIFIDSEGVYYQMVRHTYRKTLREYDTEEDEEYDTTYTTEINTEKNVKFILNETGDYWVRKDAPSVVANFDVDYDIVKTFY
jgi:hypothetical protein